MTLCRPASARATSSLTSRVFRSSVLRVDEVSSRSFSIAFTISMLAKCEETRLNLVRAPPADLRILNVQDDSLFVLDSTQLGVHIGNQLSQIMTRLHANTLHFLFLGFPDCLPRCKEVIISVNVGARWA